jgi:hypothetical protein
MDSDGLYEGIVERTINELLIRTDIPRVRRDIVDTIKRKWLEGLKNPRSEGEERGFVGDSNPVDRSKYLADAVKPLDQSIPEVYEAQSDDEFADEFGDAEFVYATQAGKKIAESTQPKPVAILPVPSTTRPEKETPKAEKVNVEELPDSLSDPEYDSIPEPRDCRIRIYGQTEVCESVEGPRRSDSRWMVTVLNGFVKIDDKEILFRTANQTVSHLYQ